MVGTVAQAGAVPPTDIADVHRANVYSELANTDAVSNIKREGQHVVGRWTDELCWRDGTDELC